MHAEARNSGYDWGRNLQECGQTGSEKSRKILKNVFFTSTEYSAFKLVGS